VIWRTGLNKNRKEVIAKTRFRYEPLLGVNMDFLQGMEISRANLTEYGLAF